MNKYKNILLWSTFVLSIFQATSSVCATENNPSIYNPTNPNQQVEPISSSLETESSVSSEDTEEKIQEIEEPKKAKEPKEKPSLKKVTRFKVTQSNRKSRDKVYLTDDLFGGNKVNLSDDNAMGGDNPKEEESFYYQLINELVGIAIYGRKS